MVRSKRLVFAGATVAALLAAAAFSLSSSSFATAAQRAVSASASKHACGKLYYNVGTMKVPVNTCQPLHLAYWQAGTINTYELAAKAAIIAAVKKIPDATLQVFDGGFDPETQYNDIEDAIASGKFNAAIVQPIDAALLCKPVTQQAPKAGILVIVQEIAVCGNMTKEGVGVWNPGTIGYVGPYTSDYFEAYLNWMAQRLGPGKHTVAAVVGPVLNPITPNAITAIDEVAKKYPNDQFIKIVTDYTAPGAESDVSAALLAHPDIDVVWTDFTDLTEGSLAALKSAGDPPSKVQVYDMGGSGTADQWIQEGRVVATSPYFPKTIIDTLVNDLVEARAGKIIPRYTQGDGFPLPKGDTSGLLVVTKANLKEFPPQYH